MINTFVQRLIAKTAAYTINAAVDRSFTRFTNRGAVGSVTFTLPALPTDNPGRYIGWRYEFEVVAGQSLIVAAAASGKIVAPGNAAADNVGFQTASKKIGGRIEVVWDGTSWHASGERAGGGFCVNGTEIGIDDQVTAGTATASRVLVLDANKSVDGGFTIRLGSATTVMSPPIVGLPADVVGAASGTTQSTFYPLSSITIPANALSVNGKGFDFMFAATTAANANAKDFRLHFGAATTTLVTGSTASGKPVVVFGSIYRTGAGAQVVVAEITIDTTSATVVTTAAADETTAWTFSLESQNTAAAAASATGKFGSVWFQN
jgi:hypothetical protein